MTQSTSETAAAPPLPSPKERRRLREALALTEEQVASAVGVTRATVRAWETGRGTPRGRKREAYARLLGTGTADAAAPPPPPLPPPVPAEAPGNVAVDAAVPDRAVAEVAETVAPEVREAPQEPEAPEAAPPVPEEVPGVPEVVPGVPEVVPGVPEVVPGVPEDALQVPDVPDVPEAPPGGPDGGQAEGAPAAAFDALYRYAASALFQQTYLLTGQRALSRAAVTKAFELAWERWPEVAVDRDPVGWVRAAAYEYAMSPWRRLNREHRRPDPPPEAPGSRALLDALLALPPSYRRTLVLHDGVGLGLPETAAETEASTRAAAGRLVTARAAVAERLPEIAEQDSPDGQSALIHERLGTLARSRSASSLPVPELIRTGSERKAQLWARTAVAFTVLIVGLTLITLATAPRKYETPPAPAQKVGGVPPVGGPQKLTPQDVKLRKKLGDELFHGPARLVPEAG
ncbi:helix-turn-helix domain-containing protein [Streptomyces sp. SID9727]|uniref:helix-turn-helix domain-containing protein n=1 Tax=Streptomyces sp. SID9727 TaxID=2706114 RepID=UPI0013CDAA7E|nr:helix-turn-helix domain-containing protein [Streptomyces sp. SID9727]NEC69495.1 helix-turn-helix domain-containing protein [Streptomyces sp. SID9727]